LNVNSRPPLRLQQISHHLGKILDLGRLRSAWPTLVPGLGIGGRIGGEDVWVNVTVAAAGSRTATGPTRAPAPGSGSNGALDGITAQRSTAASGPPSATARWRSRARWRLHPSTGRQLVGQQVDRADRRGRSLEHGSRVINPAGTSSPRRLAGPAVSHGFP
jgi:hypothetical protein